MTYDELLSEYEGLKDVLMHHTGSLCEDCRKQIEAWDKREYERALEVSRK